MIQRVLEAFFRHSLLILLPVLVIPLDVGASMLSTPPQYEAQAGMWVEQATYLSYSTDDINHYLSPAVNQRNRLVELMQTRSFLAEVASMTALAPIAAVPGGDDTLSQIFARDFEVSTNGDHLLALHFRAEDRAVAADVLNAMVQAFKARAASDRYGQAQVAITFYQSRLTDAEAELASARAQLAKYISDNPVLAAAIAKSGSDTARFDPQFAEAQRRVDASQGDANLARGSLERAEVDVAAGIKGLDFGFRIVDAVQASASPSRQLKKILLYPIVALLAGLVLSAAMLLWFALSDHSVRSLSDLGPEVIILGVLPRLRPQGVARGAGAGVTRRAVGFLAGANLPLRSKAERKAS
jgi:capsular polysaccharide biosynthesis protein